MARAQPSQQPSLRLTSSGSQSIKTNQIVAPREIYLLTLPKLGEIDQKKAESMTRSIH